MSLDGATTVGFDMLSGNQIDKLGDKLSGNVSPSPDDLHLLEQLLDEYRAVLASVEDKLRPLGLHPHGRLKTTDSIVAKLRRGKDSLRGIHDLAGTRVVQGMTLDQQRQFASEIERLFAEAKLVDRLSEPNHGYRALHVIIRIDKRWVEVQIRTLYQHVWAQTMEGLGDLLGRQIRYGELPDEPEALAFGTDLTRVQAVEKHLELSKLVADLEEKENAGLFREDHPIRKLLLWAYRELDAMDL